MVGRFTSVDPIKDGLNWYAYCYNNPIKYVDLNGLRPIPNFVYKLAGALLSHKFNSNNYDANVELSSKLVDPLGDEIIYRQEDSSISWMRYGNFPEDAEGKVQDEYRFRENGCEVIAVYNIMFIKNQRQEVYDIARYFEENGHLVLGGKWGTNPFTMGEYFDNQNIEYSRFESYDDFVNEIKDGNLFIVSVWNTDKCEDGVHTYAVEYSAGKYYAYNSGEESEQAFEADSIAALFSEELFIIGYLFA